MKFIQTMRATPLGSKFRNLLVAIIAGSAYLNSFAASLTAKDIASGYHLDVCEVNNLQKLKCNMGFYNPAHIQTFIDKRHGESTIVEVSVEIGKAAKFFVIKYKPVNAEKSGEMENNEHFNS